LGGSAIIVNVPYSAATSPGTSQWNQTLTNFRSIRNLTQQIIYVSLYTSGGSFIQQKQATVFSQADYVSIATQAYTHPSIPSGTAAVAFSGLTSGGTYYVIVNVARTISSQYVAFTNGSVTLSGTFTQLGITGGTVTIECNIR